MVDSRSAVTWIGAAFTTLIGWAILYVFWGMVVPHFDLIADIAITFGVPETFTTNLSWYLAIGFIILGLALFIFVLFAAVKVEYDQYLQL